MLTNRHKYTLKYRQIMRNSGSFEAPTDFKAARASCHPLLVHVRKTYTCGRLKKAEIYIDIVIQHPEQFKIELKHNVQTLYEYIELGFIETSKNV